MRTMNYYSDMETSLVLPIHSDRYKVWRNLQATNPFQNNIPENSKCVFYDHAFCHGICSATCSWSISPSFRTELALFAICSWSFGKHLYRNMGTFFLYRYLGALSIWYAVSHSISGLLLISSWFRLPGTRTLFSLFLWVYIYSPFLSFNSLY